jgi:hypothetical protein
MPKKISLDDIIQLVRYLRAIGVKVIDSKGEDLSPAKIEAIFNEALR